MKVLVPYDGSEQADEALRLALRTYDDAEVVVLHVIDPVGKGGRKGAKASWWNMWYEDREKLAETVLEDAREIADEEGHEIVTEIRRGKPSKKIIEYAEEEEVDAVVMGRQGETGLSRILLGSAAEKVARHTDVPVTLVGETN
ncbi:MAG: universal stress protein [Halobacteriales archaeon]|nr:universal stress protein [Halobacteriales archaeon]